MYRLRHYKLTALRVLLLGGGLCVLATCGNNPPAPVLEQGEAQPRRAPIIVDSSTPRSSFILPERERRQAQARPIGVSSNSAVLAGRSHRVKAGDTLYSIAYQYDLDFRSLAIANNLDPPYTIFVDQEINLDLNRVVNNRATSNSSLGTPVANSQVARTQGSVARGSGLIRQEIGGAVAEPDWQWPLQGTVLRKFDAGVNRGIDIGGRAGDPVVAAGDGEVVYAGSGVQGAGNLVILRHGDRFLSAYAHNRSLLVNQGARVRAGQQIAELGQNGAGVPMLHFEIRVDGDSVDPESLLPRP